MSGFSVVAIEIVGVCVVIGVLSLIEHIKKKQSQAPRTKIPTHLSSGRCSFLKTLGLTFLAPTLVKKLPAETVRAKTYEDIFKNNSLPNKNIVVSGQYIFTGHYPISGYSSHRKLE